MKIKKSNNVPIFMTKDDTNNGSEDKTWAVKQYDPSKSHPTHHFGKYFSAPTTFKIYILNHKAYRRRCFSSDIWHNPTGKKMTNQGEKDKVL